MCDNCLDNDTILEATTGGGEKKKVCQVINRKGPVDPEGLE